MVDASIVDGAVSMTGIVNSLDRLGMWTPSRQSNLLDGGAPFYRCYKTADEKFVAVGAIEPQFFAELLRLLALDPQEFGGQLDQKEWPRQHERLEQVFAGKTRDEWAALFDGSDACVTPVLDYVEAQAHPVNKARGVYVQGDGGIEPRAAPRFKHYPSYEPAPRQPKGASTKTVLASAGFSADEIERLLHDAIVFEG